LLKYSLDEVDNVAIHKAMLRHTMYCGSVIRQQSNLSIHPSSDNDFYLPSFKNLNRPVFIRMQKHNKLSFALPCISST